MGSDPEAIYRSEKDALLRFAFLIAGDRWLAEDAVADAVATCWRKLERGAIDDPGRYLRRAVANKLIDTGRHATATERAEQRRTIVEPPPLDQLVVNQAVMAEALTHLSPGQRAVVVCRFYDAMSVAETADVLSVSPGTVKSRLARALVVLREVLAGSDPDPDDDSDLGQGDEPHGATTGASAHEFGGAEEEEEEEGDPHVLDR